MEINSLSFVKLSCDVVIQSLDDERSSGKLSALQILLSRGVEVFLRPIDDLQRPLRTVVLGGEVLQNIDDDTVVVILISPSRTLGISWVGNLRFCTSCRCGSLSGQELKSKLSAGSRCGVFRLRTGGRTLHRVTR